LKLRKVLTFRVVIIKIIKLEIDITILKERFEQLSIEKRTIEENGMLIFFLVLNKLS
jgi:hypothetical protein